MILRGGGILVSFSVGHISFSHIGGGGANSFHPRGHDKFYPVLRETFGPAILPFV